MSNTSYQRMVTDMQKAGVNPAMAISSGQIGTPSSPSPTSVSPAVGNMSDLMALFSLPYQIKNIKAQTENIQADTQRSLPKRLVLILIILGKIILMVLMPRVLKRVPV